MSIKNSELVERIRKGDKQAFERFFYKYYAKLCVFSNTYVKSIDTSRDVVQDVYIKIWDNKENFEINQSLKAYLYQAVRNQSLNYLGKNSQKIRLHESLSEQRQLEAEDAGHELNTEELTEKIWKLVDKLPEKRRAIFILYRKHGLSYKEIAEVMEITRKTVENQMGRSLKFIREQLDI